MWGSKKWIFNASKVNASNPEWRMNGQYNDRKRRQLRNEHVDGDAPFHDNQGSAVV